MNRCTALRWTATLAIGLGGHATAGTLYLCDTGQPPAGATASPAPAAGHCVPVTQAAQALGARMASRGSDVGRGMTIGATLPARAIDAESVLTAEPGDTPTTPIHATTGAAPTQAPPAERPSVPASAAAAQGVILVADAHGRLRATTGSPSASAPASATEANMFHYTRNGVTIYTNTPQRALMASRLPFLLIGNCDACSMVGMGITLGRMVLNTTAFEPEIATAARTWGVSEWLVRAVIHAESGFNPAAVSGKGAQGLMQLMPGTAARFGVHDAFAADDNIRGGVQYLAFLSQRYHGDIRLIAAAYNAGEANVDRYGGVPPFAETRRYVARVASLAKRYQDKH